ncbi:MAG: aquaporin family protein [Desulfovibrionaceae bacterium]|nr:aquaporin family protein [Desulfovibrionaceae bacterium]
MLTSQRECVGELLGTFILVLIGCGSVAVSVLFEALQGLFQIAAVWGLGVALAIYATRHLSCAHLNPAVTLAMAVSGRMNAGKAPVYILAQFAGALLAGLVLYGLFGPSIAAYESAHGIVRGSAESVLTARMFGEYYQLPGGAAVVSMPLAMAAEGFGTFMLVFIIFSLTEGCNLGRPDHNLAPLFIGLTVTVLICLLAPLTQAGFNPARDFGPRLVAWAAGWREAAFPDRSGGFLLVYILAPILGGQAAALFFTRLVEPLMKAPATACTCSTTKEGTTR